MVPMLNCLPNRLIDECIASAPTNDHVFNAPGGVKSVKDTMFNNMRCFSCGFPLSFVIQAYQANSICVMDTLDAWALCAQPNAYI